MLIYKFLNNLQYYKTKYSQTCLYGHLYQAVTCIKRSPFSCPDIEQFISMEPLLRGHLSYKATFSLSQRWPLNTGLTVQLHFHSCLLQKNVCENIPVLHIPPKAQWVR